MQVCTSVCKMRIFIFILSINSILYSCKSSNDPEPSVGNVVFWTKRSDIYYNSSTDFNIIDIQLEGLDGNRFIFFPNETAPDCIEDEDATYYFIRPGTYKLTAESTLGKKWSGTINVDIGCNPVELK